MIRSIKSDISAIWTLQIVAATVYRTGNLPAAASIMELADAAERERMMVANVASNTECSYSLKFPYNGRERASEIAADRTQDGDCGNRDQRGNKTVLDPVAAV